MTHEEAYKLFMERDWSGFAEAYAKSESRWHAAEWERFIQEVEYRAKRQLVDDLSLVLEQPYATVYTASEIAEKAERIISVGRRTTNVREAYPFSQEDRVRDLLCKEHATKTMICGNGFTNYQCIECGETISYRNTCVPLRCFDCATKDGKCQRCDREPNEIQEELF